MLTFLERFARQHVLVVGDLMIDEYLWGEVDRISPEAPVQIVSVLREDLTLGGAGNVVNNLASLGARVSVAGVVGTGADGRRMLELFAALRADTRGVVQEAARPTTRKTRVIASNQHVLRIDRETRRAVGGDAFERLVAFLESTVAEADVVLVSDYDKGLITPELVRRLVAAARRHRRPVLVDPKGMDFAKYRGTTMLTPNRKEASLATGIEIVDDASLAAAAVHLLEVAHLEKLLITRGKDGMVLFDRQAPPYVIPTVARQVYDVSGAGDTVLAVLGLTLAAGAGYEEAVTLANAAAGIVVGKVGTAPVTLAELEQAAQPAAAPLPRKQRQIEEMAGYVHALRRRGSRIVLTNGCFDLLHVGHIKLFEAAKQLGDTLIVAIDDDAAVRSLKGAGRPVIGAEERVRILSALDSVDAVVVFGEGELEQLIAAIRPDVLAKGSNYAPEEVRGHDLVERHGGRVALIPVEEALSSSRIIDSIRNG
jgi:D-beta-D-heptose 7-phosphate kinase/D-beta-D-heptose 1-phosphate adenosyltransferase